MSRAERRALGIQELPNSLHEAIQIMESSELVADTLGEETFGYFVRNKLTEWEEYRSQVTPFELRRFIPAL